MAKYKRYDYSQSVLIPVSLEEQLVPGTLEFAIHTLVERRMDMSVFDLNYQNDETGRSAYDPKILLKVVLLGYSRGLISSRQIERACCENVLFMAMSCNQRPDHSTIAAFVSSMKDQIKPLFTDILLVCEQEGLLGGTFFALDGVKLPSNASKQWSGTHAKLHRKKEALEGKLRQLLEEHERKDKGDDDPPGPGSLARFEWTGRRWSQSAKLRIEQPRQGRTSHPRASGPTVLLQGFPGRRRPRASCRPGGSTSDDAHRAGMLERLSQPS